MGFIVFLLTSVLLLALKFSVEASAYLQVIVQPLFTRLTKEFVKWEGKGEQRWLEVILLLPKYPLYQVKYSPGRIIIYTYVNTKLKYLLT